MTALVLTVDDEPLEIDLDTAGAPGLTAALLACTPHPTVAVHTQTAGAEFCVPVPFFHWHENRREPVTGDVGYASFGNYVCLYHGDMSEADGPTNVVGRVRDLDALARVGRALLASGGARARLTAPSAKPASPTAARHPGSAFLAACDALSAASLMDPPPAVAALTAQRLPAMGAIAGRLQASGFLMGLAEVMFLIRLHAVRGSASPGLLSSMLADELARHARWLEMSGMAALAGQLRDAASALPADIAVDELVHGLETLLVAAGRLRLWVEAISPWHVLQQRLGGEDWLAPSLARR